MVSPPCWKKRGALRPARRSTEGWRPRARFGGTSRLELCARRRAAPPRPRRTAARSGPARLDSASRASWSEASGSADRAARAGGACRGRGEWRRNRCAGGRRRRCWRRAAAREKPHPVMHPAFPFLGAHPAFARAARSARSRCRFRRADGWRNMPRVDRQHDEVSQRVQRGAGDRSSARCSENRRDRRPSDCSARAA